jgi:phage terminase large subunit-like protein
MTDTFNGMGQDEQPPIPLHAHHLTIRIETSAEVDMTEALREAIGDAVWRCLPVAEDGDVFLEIVT